MVNNVTTDRNVSGVITMNTGKRVKSARFDFFDALSDDIVLSILTRVVSTADCPADFIAVLATCKRFHDLGLDSIVLSKASAETFSVKAMKWSEAAHRFLERCSDAGNVEASYILGMIQFYCFENRNYGASLMVNSAKKSHAPAQFSLAVILFNGSACSKNEINRRAAVCLCERAASLGHIGALRELGHCLQDGYGVTQNTAEGLRLCAEASQRELGMVQFMPQSAFMLRNLNQGIQRLGYTVVDWSPLPAAFEISVPQIYHPANRFLADWYKNRTRSPGLEMCSVAGCGRSETRMNEFRRCLLCGVVHYCSRACQALDWKTRHQHECAQLLWRFLMVNANPYRGGGR